MNISVACHSAHPRGWCIIISAFGKANLFHFFQADNKNAHIEAAIHTHTVATSHFI
jgi:hypothetical protein